MTQATTTTVLKYNCCMESYTTSKHSTKTTIACDTSSIQVDITDTMVYAITLCKLLDFTQSFGQLLCKMLYNNTYEGIQ